MGMASLQFYQNKYRYPHYGTISAYGPSMPCTPVGVNLKSGTLRVKGDMTMFMSCNYLSLTRDGSRIFAWIEDVRFRTEDSFEVSYSVDAWRTYRSKIDLGYQLIARQPTANTLRDRLLGSDTDYPNISSIMNPIGNPSKRVFVVQVRAQTGELFSRTPVNPTPYQFFMKEYDVNNWTDDMSLDLLMSYLSSHSDTENIVTMYSIPYMDLSTLTAVDLPVITPNETFLVNGFKFLGQQDPTDLLSIETYISLPQNIDEILRTDHSVQIVIPEAGIIQIPDELLVNENLLLRQDVDLFSGACNYMLVDGDGKQYTQSVRGSSISSIPVVSDPMDTYLSQNQNALATSLIGDVASIAGGVAVAAGTGGIGAALGAGSVMSGINGIVGRRSSIEDAGSRYSNPPAFLGTALAPKFNQQYWVVTTRTGVTNADIVHSNFGYPLGIVDKLTFPDKGFIQTEGCSVFSIDGSVPKWAIDEINQNFNRGILVH